MVLRCYLHVACLQSPDRMIGAVMAEGEFEGFPAECQPEYLVTQTDPEYRLLTNESLDVLDCIRDRLRVAGAVR